MYGKFFASTYTGSMLGAGADVFAVWGYVIAHTVDSQVELNPTLVSYILGMTPERVSTAIDYLCKPDPNSRNKEQEGRRLIKEGQFAYVVVSHRIYRKIQTSDERRDSARERQRKHRSQMSHDVTDVRHTEAEAEAEAEKELKTSCSPRYEIPLNDGTLFPISEFQISKWATLYPAVDVNQAIRSMIGWCEANPAKRKTHRGVPRFINSWLDREQNRPHTERTNGNGKARVDQAQALRDFILRCDGEDASPLPRKN